MRCNAHLSVVLLATVLIISLTALSGFGFIGVGSADTTEDLTLEDLDGEGDETNPYLITNVSALQLMNEDPTAQYQLASDIDASETESWNDGDGFEPIDDDSPTGPFGFSGTFDGAGYSISNLHIDRATSDGTGLVGTLSEDGNISNVQVVDANISSSERVGAIAGENHGGTITQVNISGEITASSTQAGGVVGLQGESGMGGEVTHAEVDAVVTGGFETGGVVGVQDSGTIENATFAGSVTSDGGAGGITDWNVGTILQSSTNGTIEGDNAGGIAATNDGTIAESYSHSTVIADADAGGIAAANDEDGTISAVYVADIVQGDGTVGAIVGDNYDEFADESGLVSNAYWDESETQQADAVGSGEDGIEGDVQGLSTEAMTGDNAVANMTAFDFDEIWTSIPEAYPMLQVQVPPTDPAPEPVSTSIDHIDGPAPEMDAISIDAFASDGSTQIQLVNESAPEGVEYLDQREDLAGLGADEDTVFELEVQVEGPEPQLLVGAGIVHDWEVIEDDDDVYTISMEVSPIEQQMILDCEAYPDGCVPDLDDWPTGDDDTATSAREATVGLSVDPLDDLNDADRSLLSDMYVATDAQAFGTPVYDPVAEEFSVFVAGPNATADGEKHTGIYEAFLPEVLLTEWGIEDPEAELVASFDGAAMDFDVEELDDGTVISLNVSYSAGQISITPAEDLAGEGTEENPYVITTVAELQAMQQDPEAHYVLGNDIDASETANWNEGKGFAPIPGETGRFQGSLDGNGHTISGLTIDRPEEDRIGLIRYNDGTIANLSLEDVEIIGADMVGAISGNTGPASTITNVTVSGTVEGDDSVGGMLGLNIGTVANANSSGTVHGEGRGIGGLIGDNGGGEVRLSRSNATVTGTDDWVGGLIGKNEAEVKASYATGDVTGDGSIGGVIGTQVGGTVKNVYATGDISGDIRVGGVIGDASIGEVRNMYAAGTVDGETWVGGVIGNTHISVHDSYWLQEDLDAVGRGMIHTFNVAQLNEAEMTGHDSRDHMEFDFREIWTTTTAYPELRALTDSVPDSIWEADGFVESSPTIIDGVAYIGDGAGNVTAVNVTDGEKHWTTDISDGQIRTSVQVVDDMAYVGSTDYSVYALNASTGEEQWAYQTGSYVTSDPTRVGDRIFVGSEDGHMYALDAETGEERWRFDADGAVVTAPTVVDELVYFGNKDDSLYATHTIYALDAHTGEEVWSVDTDLWINSDVTVVDGTAYVGSDDSTVYALDATDGSLDWQFTQPDAHVISATTVHDDVVYVATDDTTFGVDDDPTDAVLYALDADSGDLLWEFSVNEEGDEDDWQFHGSPTVAGGTVYISNVNGKLYGLNTTYGTPVWEYDAGTAIWSSPTVYKDDLFIGGDAQVLYRINIPDAGSSEDSRITLGTLGHLDGWAADALDAEPHAAFTIDRDPPTEGDAIEFDGSVSYQPDSIVEFRWDFTDDGEIDETTTTPEITHIFDTHGEFDVTLEIEYDDAEAISTTRTLEILEDTDEPHLRALDVDGPDEVDQGETITVDISIENIGTATATDDSHPVRLVEVGESDDVYFLERIKSWEVSVDDLDPGSTEATDIDLRIPLDAEPGWYIIESPTTGGFELQNITVEALDPSPAAFTYERIDPVEDRQIQFDATEATSPYADPVEYRWNFTDDDEFDSTTSEPVTTFTYEAGGEFDVTLEVEYADGQTATKTKPVASVPALDIMDGSGTEADPYVITTVWELQGMQADLDAHYVLGNDIDTSGAEDWRGGDGFVPIGDDETPFTGSFDGQGHVIDGLTVSRTAERDVGLFGEIAEESTITDVVLEEVTIEGEARAGGLAGTSHGNVSQVRVTGTVSGKWSMGGLIGENYHTVTESNSTVDVSGKTRIAGLVGLNDGLVNTSYATGDIDGESQVGGLLGENRETVAESYATGDVEGDDSDVGGLLGLNMGSVSDTYATGDVDGDDHVGGLLGQNLGTLTQSYATGAVDGNGDVGAVVGLNDDENIHDGEMTDIYWDTDTVNQADGIGRNDGTAENVTRLSTDEMTGSEPADHMAFDFETTWTTTSEYPQLVTLYEPTEDEPIDDEPADETDPGTTQPAPTEDDDPEDEPDVEPEPTVDTVVETTDDRTTVETTVSDAEAGEEVSIEVASPEQEQEYDLEAVSVTPAVDGDFELSIDVSTEPVETTPDAGFQFDNTAALGYINVDTDLDDEAIDEVSFTYTVAEDTIDDLNSDPSDVALQRYDENSDTWEPHETEVVAVSEDTGEVTFETTADRFSNWAATAERPALEITDTSIDVDSVTIGEEVIIEVVVTNTGGADGTFEAELLANDGAIDQKTTTVPGDSMTTIEFAEEFHEVTVYEIAVNDITVGTVDVTADDTTPDEVDEPVDDRFEGILPMFGIGIALLVLALGGYIIYRRYSPNS